MIADNTPESFALAIETIINNKQLMQKMGFEGQKYVEAHYSRQGIANDLKNAMHTLIRKEE
jgi:glycosyltransferase involved in cell wall biosynthesis